MGIGKASVYKYIPNYFPNDVGAVGGLVGLFGALGGFILPKLFGWLGRASGFPQAAFLALLAITIISLVWLLTVVVQLNRAQALEAFESKSNSDSIRPTIGKVGAKPTASVSV